MHPNVAKEQLGHSTIALTLDLYSHVTPTLQAEAVAELDRFFLVQALMPILDAQADGRIWRIKFSMNRVRLVA